MKKLMIRIQFIWTLVVLVKICQRKKIVSFIGFMIG